MKKHKTDEKKYSLWSNYQYVYRTAWKVNQLSVIMPVVRMISEVIVTLAGVALPAIVIGCLQSNLSFGAIARILAVCFAAAGGFYWI